MVDLPGLEELHCYKGNMGTLRNNVQTYYKDYLRTGECSVCLCCVCIV